MSGFALVPGDGAPERAAARLTAADAAYAAQGFAAGEDLNAGGWTGRFYPRASDGPAGLYRRGADFAAVAGTITVDGAMGEPALAALLDMTPRLDWDRIGGHFVALLARGEQAWLFTDWFGAFPLYDVAGDGFATTLTGAMALTERLSFDAQGLYEFAFNVTPIGDDTVFNELKLVGGDALVTLAHGGAKRSALAKPLPLPEEMPVAERIARNRAALTTVLRPYVAAFGERIACPLSGGLDSRLLLAALRAEGADPAVYVYGPAGSADVRVARAIGAADGFPIEWIDKQEAPLPPDAFADQVAANYAAMDALPNYGNIFDNGGNTAAQSRRHADGALAASGGCGEIWRDFFFLPDRPIGVATVADAFFGRFARSDATDRFDPRLYLANVATKLGTAIGASADERVPRGAVEHLYPRIRCRALFGREIGMEAAAGAYLMPFLDHRVVAEAMRTPLPLKFAGTFESALLTAIDPGLARHMSAYGHDFAGGPSRRHRFDEWSTRIRPPWVRRKSYAIQRRLRPMGDEHGGLLDPEYMGRVIDPAMPAMQRWFDVGAIGDAGLWRRVACLEYLAGRLGGKLVGD